MDEDDATLISDCMKRDARLTDWEREFLDSLDHRLGRGKGLTGAQRERLEQIWERVTANG